MAEKKKKSNPKLKAEKPKSITERSFEIDLKSLFKSLSKAAIHTASGKLEEVGNDAVDSLSAIGLNTKPEELAFLLIRRSVIHALFDLVGESASEQIIDKNEDPEALTDPLDFSIRTGEVYIDKKFLDRPAELPILKEIQKTLGIWLEGLGVSKPSATAIADRLPSYFVYALNQEWRKNAKSYRLIIEALDTPFARAGDREWAWMEYSSLLQRRVQEGIFDEPFSLSQMYIPLNAFYLEEKDDEEPARIEGKYRRVVVSLDEELKQWLENPNAQDAIRVISGGPGSGKSSFVRIFAARLSDNPKLKVLYVPLHLIDATKDFAEEIGRFVRDEGVLFQNPLDPESPEPNLLIILDGLDELASQGKAAAETARAFIRELDRTVEKRNLRCVNLRILLSGRELIVQENESEFRRPRQILTLLPYYMPDESKIHYRYRNEHYYHDVKKYYDPNNLLKNDLRQEWWKNYGSLTGRVHEGLPKELDREDLEEITAQPLLNYLVALTFSRGNLDFSEDINLNSIYSDLVAAVHERGYEKYHNYGPIRHMNLKDFSRVLEEIGLAAWHGDGRSTTVSEIEKHCQDSGVGRSLEAFEDGAKAGVTRLLAAFFFRQYGQRPSGDRTFIFTHKSFGEYLTARRIVRAIERAMRELERRNQDADEGWDEKDALKHWAQICGPSAITPYLHVFLLNEIKLKSVEELAQWQERLAKLFSYMLKHGMPMQMLQLPTFKTMLFQSRNAEEALLVAMNACARMTGKVSQIEHPGPTAFGEWFRRIQGQRSGPESALAARCLSFLELAGTHLDIIDFYNADLRSSNLRNAQANFSCFIGVNLENSDLRFAILSGAMIKGASLKGANLEGARLREANLDSANLRGANLNNAILRYASLQIYDRLLAFRGLIKNRGVIFNGADFEGADLEGAKLEGADLKGVNLVRVNLRGANLEGANLKEANLEGADLEGANLERADLRGVKLEEANLKGANLERANLEGANLKEANLEGADLEGAKLERADLRGAKLEEANLKGADLERASLRNRF